MLRPRARVFTPVGAAPASVDLRAPDKPLPPLYVALLPTANPQLDFLVLEVPDHGLVRRYTASLLARMHAAEPPAWQSLNLHVSYSTPETLAREVLFGCLAMQLALYRAIGTPDDRPPSGPALDRAVCCRRLQALMALLEHSLGLPPYFRALLDCVLDNLVRMAGTCKLWNAAELKLAHGPFGKAVAAPVPFRFASETTLAAVRKVWQDWQTVRHMDLMTVLHEVSEVPPGTPTAPLDLKGSAEPQGENFLSSVICDHRSALPLSDCPPAAAEAHARHEGHPSCQAEILHWHRFLSLSVPQSLHSDLRFVEGEERLPTPGKKALGELLPAPILLTSATPPPERLTKWDMNPLFLRRAPLRHYALSPVAPLQCLYHAPPEVAPAGPDSAAPSLLGSLMSAAAAFAGDAAALLLDGTPHMQLHVYLSGAAAGLEMVCDLATAHRAPHVTTPPLEHTPAYDTKPSEGGIFFDVIDATNASAENSLSALLVLLQPMLKVCNTSFLLTRHTALEATPRTGLSDCLQFVETLTGANLQMLQKIFGVRPRGSAEDTDPLTVCWQRDPEQDKNEVLNDSDEFRQLFWRILHNCLLPKHYNADNPMRSITARDFPCLENTGTLVAMFDLVHRKRKLPGPGFVESLLQDTFFQGISSSAHIKLSIQVMCRQYLNTLHENVVAAPAQCLPLCSVLPYQIPFRLLNDMTDMGYYPHDSIPLAVVLVYKNAQTDSWYRLREAALATWLTEHKGSVHVLDNLELLEFGKDKATVALYLPEAEVAKKAGKQLALLHWEHSTYLSEPCPMENVTIIAKGRKRCGKKKGKKTAKDAGAEGEGSGGED